MRVTSHLKWFCLSLLLLSQLALATDEPIAVIVSTSLPIKLIKKEDVSLIFKRKKLFWSDGTKIHPVNISATSPYRRLFSQSMLSAMPEEMEDYWNNMYFHGVSPPFTVASETAALKFIEDTPGAIGYVPVCTVSNKVNIVFIITSSGKISDDLSLFPCPK